MDNRTKALCDFLNAAHSVYHAQAYLAETLKNAGYTRLYEQDEWPLIPGGKYFLTRGGSALVAFRVPKESPKGFLMSASHADRPCFKVKENFELTGTYNRMAVEEASGVFPLAGSPPVRRGTGDGGDGNRRGNEAAGHRQRPAAHPQRRHPHEPSGKRGL